MRPIDTDAFVAEIVKIDDLRKLSTATIGKAIHAMPTLNVAPVIHCQDCEHCTMLADGVGFNCEAWDMDLYAPYYDVKTYYCADGKRRDATCT